MRKFLIVLVAFTFLMNFAFGQNIFMKVTNSNGNPINGSATLIAHANEIEINTYSTVTAVCQSGPCIGIQELAINLPVWDASTIYLRQEMHAGRPLGSVILSSGRITASSFQDRNKVTLDRATITSMTEVYDSEGTVVLQITLRPEKVGWTTIPINNQTGAALPAVKYGWDFVLNKAWTAF